VAGDNNTCNQKVVNHKEYKSKDQSAGSEKRADQDAAPFAASIFSRASTQASAAPVHEKALLSCAPG